MRLRLLFLVGFLFVTFLNLSYSQGIGSPFITNFSASTYNLDSQNWDVIKDNRGIMYFGNTGGLLEYDGTDWRKIDVENNLGVRSLAIDSLGTIYVGCAGAFGFLAPDSLGTMKYHSISALYDTTIIKAPPNVWRIRILNNEVYFNSFAALYRYSPYKNNTQNINEKIKVWYPKKKFFLPYVVNDKFYIQSAKEGLLEMQNDTFRVILDQDHMKGHIVFDMVAGLNKQNPQEILIAFNDGLLKYDPEKGEEKEAFTNYKTEADHLIDEYSLYDIEVLPDDKIALSILSKGIIIIDSSGSIVEIINTQNGLQDETVWKISYLDDVLWCCTNNGISYAEVHSPFRIWDVNNGIKGSIQDIIKMHDKLYLATSSSICYIDLEQDYKNGEIPSFNHISISTNAYESWCLLKYFNPSINDTILLSGHNGGILEIHENEITNEILSSTIYTLLQSKNHPDIIYAGGLNSLYLLKHNDQTNTWDSKRIKGFNGQVRSICEFGDEIWLTTLYNGVFKIKIDSKESLFDIGSNDYNTVQYKQNGLGSIKNNMVYCIDDKLVFASPFGFLSYHNELDSFLIIEQFNNLIDENGNGTYYLNQNNHGSICLDGSAIMYKQKDGALTVNNTYSKRLSKIQGGIVYAEPNDNWLIGGANGLLRINQQKKYDYNKSFKSFIRKVSVKGDSVLFYGTPYKFNTSTGIPIVDFSGAENIPPVIDHDYNSLSFEFSCSYYIQSQENEYSFFLEGFDEEWSSWHQDTDKEYTNLPKGTYTFHVKAKNLYGSIGDEATFKFKVLPPWYRSWWAFSIYIILLIWAIFIIVRLNEKRLRRINANLENTIEKRTSEILNKNIILENQKAELVIQNNKIHAQTIELKKANDTKEKFFSIIAHDLKNPFNVILGFAQEISESYDIYSDKEKKEMLFLLEKSSKNTYLLLENLLTWAQSQQNSITITKIECRLKKLIDSIIETYNQNASRKNISIANNVSSNIIAFIDKPSLSFAFGNIINNAIKFTETGGKININSKLKSDNIEISVEDTGIGMSHETIKKLFRIDENHSTPGTAQERGTGLGLILSKEFVIKNDGKIIVESVLGKGSKFVIILKKYQVE